MTIAQKRTKSSDSAELIKTGLPQLNSRRVSTSIMYRQRGFTLVELLVVIAVIALLMLMLLPALHNLTKWGLTLVSLCPFFCLKGFTPIADGRLFAITAFAG